MNVLIIDRDALLCQFMTTKLEQIGHSVLCEENKNIAIKKLERNRFDCIFIDPSPLKNVRAIVFDILKMLGSKARPYIVLLSKEASKEDAISGFCNDILHKPLDHSALETLMGNAERLKFYCNILNSNKEDDRLGSGFGIIDRNSFGQLFLSSIDRGFRYLERNFVLFVNITNFSEIVDGHEEEKTLRMLDKFSENLSWVRRQSDVIGRVSMNIFGILLQRPMYDTEINDAFSRFQEKVGEISSVVESEFSLNVKININISVVELPFCGLVFNDNI